jgi:hypothetical protein
MKLNAFLSTSPAKGVATRYELEGYNPTATSADRFRTTWRVCRDFPKGTLAIPFRNASEVIAFGPGPPEIVTEGIRAVKREEITLDFEDGSTREAFKLVIQQLIAKRLSYKGYRKYRGAYVSDYYKDVALSQNPVKSRFFRL